MATEVKVFDDDVATNIGNPVLLERRSVTHVHVNALDTQTLLAQGLNRRHQIAI
jgi:hypothetical protein